MAQIDVTFRVTIPANAAAAAGGGAAAGARVFSHEKFVCRYTMPDGSVTTKDGWLKDDGSGKVKVEAGCYVVLSLPTVVTYGGEKFFRHDATYAFTAPKNNHDLGEFEYAAATKPKHEISGRLVQQAASGQLPLGKLPVVIRDATGQKVAEVETGPNGWFQAFVQNPGRYTVDVNPEYQSMRASQRSLMIDVGPDQKMCIEEAFVYSARAARIGGTVLNEKGGGIPGVRVHLTHESGLCRDVPTDECGHYCFEHVPPGKVSLAFPDDVMTREGKYERAYRKDDWERNHTHDPARRKNDRDRDCEKKDCDSYPGPLSFYLKEGQSYDALSVHYVPETHSITWCVQQGNDPAVHILVELLDNNDVIAQDRTDDYGCVRFEVEKAGSYDVKVYPDPAEHGGAMVYKTTVNSHVSRTTKLAPAGPPRMNFGLPGGGGGGGGGGIIGNFAGDLQAYPLLTDVVNRGGSRGSSRGGAAGAALGGLVENTIRDVLGWRPRAGETKAFVAALNQSFPASESNGVTQYNWSPRSYAANIQADLGALTGAQASLYSRARNALDQSLPLLDGLYPLLTDADSQDTEAIRALVRSDMTELVNELGTIGGPRVQRVDRYFGNLLGNNAFAAVMVQSPDRFGGNLGILQNRFGLLRTQISTVEEEQDFTNLLILGEHLNALRASWVANRPFFNRQPGGPEPFLGTQLVLLSRALAVVADGVREANDAMDSVFLDADQRTTIRLDLGLATPPLFASELLDWVDDVAGQEGPRQLEAGKDGVQALAQTLTELAVYVQQALVLGYPGGMQLPANVPPAYATPRVQRALQELATQIVAARDLANRIQPKP